MAEIYHQVGIKAPIDKIHEYLTTEHGIKAWWTDCKLVDSAGSTYVVLYIQEHMYHMEVYSNGPDSITWQPIVIDGDEVETGNWANTWINFSLSKEKSQTIVNFIHQGWDKAGSSFSAVSTKWAVFLLSLKEAVESGVGRPYPNDIQINHY
ncbi:SRPBCC domain-containing protein [Vibrio sp. SCSIO 43135]|uniref:SRPBCC family protein n=1 Tax=Vibrio sp. SCSIO 43135 TaxID=2819096 RepID=UPI002075AB10|nr:SRPBCC domain-containing protein [Vibrio sp. SCSIO 43135]USD43573.1 SRPBCC domain-containing protein [Vibrio sp. SCSIO 43135]